MKNQEYLEKCMALCTVEEIPSGHRATFRGVSGIFQFSDGPNAWTEKMARQAALFFWALNEKKADEVLQKSVRHIE